MQIYLICDGVSICLAQVAGDLVKSVERYLSAELFQGWMAIGLKTGGQRSASWTQLCTMISLELLTSQWRIS